MIRAVLFDFEGTLVDFAAIDSAALFEAGAERCYAFLSAHERSLPTFEAFVRQQRWVRRRIEWMRRLTGGEPNLRPVLKRICRDYGLQRDQASLGTLGWSWYEPLADRATVAADVKPTLTALAKANIELGLIVNSAYPAGVIDYHLEKLGLLEFFATRAYSTEIGAQKPDARLFTAALESMHVTAAEAIYVGDEMKTDMLGASRVGMMPVLRGKLAGTSTIVAHQISGIGELLDLPELAHLRPVVQPNHSPIPALIV